MKDSKTMQVDSFRDLVRVLDKEGLSSSPTYCGFGLEVYEDKAKQIQVIFNCRGGKNELTINRGF